MIRETVNKWKHQVTNIDIATVHPIINIIKEKLVRSYVYFATAVLSHFPFGDPTLFPLKMYYKGSNLIHLKYPGNLKKINARSFNPKYPIVFYSK